uniref:KID domain-containing protein n=1 Tax=Ascaris lumbricoides TaxID=6252 RepID=A0A0M3HQG6_ASCLU
MSTPTVVAVGSTPVDEETDRRWIRNATRQLSGQRQTADNERRLSRQRATTGTEERPRTVYTLLIPGQHRDTYSERMQRRSSE